MRFSILFSLALAGVSIAAPISQASINAPIEARAAKCFSAQDGLVQQVGKLVATLEKDLGVTAVEDALDKVLPLVPVENALGLTKLEQALGLEKGCAKPGVIQKLGAVVKHLEDTLGVTALENALDKTLGGTLSDLEESLGLPKAEEGLGLE